MLNGKDLAVQFELQKVCLKLNDKCENIMVGVVYFNQ